jgi:hypothetical protein
VNGEVNLDFLIGITRGFHVAFIACPECRREVSERAPTCPRCGCPVASQVVLPSQLQESTPIGSSRPEPATPQQSRSSTITESPEQSISSGVPDNQFFELKEPSPLAKLASGITGGGRPRNPKMWVIALPIALVVFGFSFSVIPTSGSFSHRDSTLRLLFTTIVTAVLSGIVAAIVYGPSAIGGPQATARSSVTEIPTGWTWKVLAAFVGLATFFLGLVIGDIGWYLALKETWPEGVHTLPLICATLPGVVCGRSALMFGKRATNVKAKARRVAEYNPFE